ncbi:MAG TPA: hypothetical protein DER07_04165 [Armatimonadetes bacterium]|nr:DUF935 domain-containing protein [Armatimonadota bacterium]HCE00216.1 hypothetical protein [Armatimonadota bacterium]
MKLWKHLFAKRRKPRDPQTPQLTRWQADALARSSVPPGAPSYALLDEMQRDAMVQTALTLKRLGVLAAPWRVAEPDASPEAARRTRFVREAFARMEGSPTGVLDAAMDAFAKGWSVQELVFEEDAGAVWLRAARPKDPALFGLDVDRFGRIQGLILRLPGEPDRRVPVGKFALYVHRPTYARPTGRSDLEAALPHWQAKRALLEAWRLHLERFASPTVTGRFDPGLPPEEQAALLEALQNLHRNLALVFPNQIEVGTIGGDKESSSGFLEAVDFHNREIARAILGQTLTTDEGRRVGSMALGKVHFQVLLLQLEAIRRDLADTVMTEQIIRPLVELNFGPGPVPRFEFEPLALGPFATGTVA